MRGLFLLSLLALSCSSLKKVKEAEGWEQICYQGFAAKQEYCISKTGYSNDITVIDFHGLGDGVKSPKISTYNTEQRVELIRQIGASHVVSISYGLAWMMKPFPGNESVEEVENAIILLRQKYALPKKTIAVGMSMGGFNAGQFCLNSEIPEKCVLLNPMVLGPDDYKTSIDFKNVKDASVMPGKHFTPQEWQVANLFNQAAAKAQRRRVIWVSACRQDDFGLFQPTERWAKEFQLSFKASDCDHFNPQIQGALDFINQ